MKEGDLLPILPSRELNSGPTSGILWTKGESCGEPQGARTITEPEKGRPVLEFVSRQRDGSDLFLSKHGAKKVPAEEPASVISRHGSVFCVHVSMWWKSGCEGLPEDWNIETLNSHR